MISAEQLPQIFWIKARGQRGRADQIAEHDSELPALGRAGADAGISALSHRLGRWDGRTGSWRAAVSQRGDRVQQLSSMTNRRNAQPNQIISGEFRQNFGIDIVREECSRILFESQAAQPIGDVDRHYWVRGN